MSLAELILRNELKREQPTTGEINRLLEGIDRRLQDAANEANHPETRLEQAYHAILGCGLAALRLNVWTTTKPFATFAIGLCTQGRCTSQFAKQKKPLMMRRSFVTI